MKQFSTALESLKIQLAPADSGRCSNGWIYWFDSDYQCGGCYRCSRDVKAAFAVGAFVFAMGGGRERTADALGAFRALAAIGQAVEAAGSLGESISRAFRFFVMEWNGGPYKRAWYQVVTKRGSAKAHFGFVGECFWKGTNSYGGEKIGLKNSKGDKAFVPAGSVERVLAPKWFIEQAQEHHEMEDNRKAKSKLLAFSFMKNDIAFCPVARMAGRVFWVGEKNGVMRVGMKNVLDDAAKAEWRDAAELVPYQPEKVKSRIIDAEMAERFAVRMAEVGMNDTADKWMTVAKEMHAEVSG